VRAQPSPLPPSYGSRLLLRRKEVRTVFKLLANLEEEVFACKALVSLLLEEACQSNERCSALVDRSTSLCLLAMKVDVGRPLKALRSYLVSLNLQQSTAPADRRAS
jgi:hypothetical protein